jgi:hypothetical protein
MTLERRWGALAPIQTQPSRVTGFCALWQQSLVQIGVPPWTVCVLHHDIVVEGTHLHQYHFLMKHTVAKSHEQEDCSILCQDQPSHDVFIGSVQDFVHYVVGFSIHWHSEANSRLKVSCTQRQAQPLQPKPQAASSTRLHRLLITVLILQPLIMPYSGNTSIGRILRFYLAPGDTVISTLSFPQKHSICQLSSLPLSNLEATLQLKGIGPPL